MSVAEKLEFILDFEGQLKQFNSDQDKFECFKKQNIKRFIELNGEENVTEEFLQTVYIFLLRTNAILSGDLTAKSPMFKIIRNN